MSICADKDWNDMKLIKFPSDPQKEETFDFKDVRVVNGVITGKVYDKRGEFISNLKGTCSQFGENLAHLNFLFTAARANNQYVDIFLFGLGIKLADERVVFRGGFLVLDPTSPGQSARAVNFEVGDTGTGTGMQAQ